MGKGVRDISFSRHSHKINVSAPFVAFVVAPFLSNSHLTDSILLALSQAIA
jgi:hypothetical protein